MSDNNRSLVSTNLLQTLDTPMIKEFLFMR